MKNLPHLNTSLLRSRLKLKTLTSESTLRKHHSKAIALLEGAGIRPGGLRAHAAKLLTTGTLASSLLLTPGHSQAAISPSSQPSTSINSLLEVSPPDMHSALSSNLATALPTSVTPLTPDQELEISRMIEQTYGLKAVPVLQSERLNRSYGYIGQEQHLKRFPGDTLDQHTEPLREGMAPGLGGWGYFARSKPELTPELVEVEKYYVAVQTLYLPDWYTRLPHQREWWKYRRMVVVNPKNGKIIIAAVGDSGPAWWTGKSFGGSPEVMDYLDMQDGKQKGPVIMFFLDDPAGTIPLGPVEYNINKGIPILA